MKSLTYCKELPGLPGYGESLRHYSATGQGMHRDGYVVEFNPSQGQSWVGNFQPGGGNLSDLEEFTANQTTLVVAKGQGYLVDIQSGTLIALYESDINFLLKSAATELVIAGTATDFSAYTGIGKVWTTRRISWDGFRNLVVNGGELVGESWCFDDSWLPFKVDLSNGIVTGGAYYE
jgi:hypothetical protein